MSPDMMYFQIPHSTHPAQGRREALRLFYLMHPGLARLHAYGVMEVR